MCAVYFVKLLLLKVKNNRNISCLRFKQGKSVGLIKRSITRCVKLGKKKGLNGCFNLVLCCSFVYCELKIARCVS